MGFELATAWRWDDDAQLLRCEHVWQSPDAASLGMRRVAGMTVASGEGCPAGGEWGRSAVGARAAGGQLQATADHAPRRVAQRFRLPIRTRGRLFAWSSCSPLRLQPDPPLAAAVSDLGSRLGEFIERLMLEEQRNRLLAEVEQARRRQDFLLRRTRRS